MVDLSSDAIFAFKPTEKWEYIGFKRRRNKQIFGDAAV
jgi:hypothetical protein